MMKSRHALLLGIMLLGCAFSQTVTGQTNALAIPPTLDGPDFDLTMDEGTHAFFPDAVTPTMGFNGGYLGPTLIMEKGEIVNIMVHNQLGESTTVHWHGMHIPSEDDGGPHGVIEAGTTWNPEFEVMNRATSFWYHPHLHEHTNEQVYRGLAGMIIVRDDIEAALDLPRTYGVDDIPLIVQDRRFTPQRELVFNGGGVGEQGNTIVVNGTVDAFVEVPAQVVRFRLLNGSSARVYQFGFQDNRTFQLIGSDGGLLAAPVPLTRLTMAPGERNEILLDLGAEEGNSLNFISWSSELTHGEPGGADSNAPPGGIDGTDFDVIQIRVGAANNQDGTVTAIPATLDAPERIPAAQADRTRDMALNNTGPGGPLSINGVELDLDIINEVVQLGDTEIWSITNETMGPHPFHIHDIQFNILDRSGQPPVPAESGHKDTILIYPGETVRVIARFEDFADPDTPYMYHCHFLGHEDGGMMGQFVVLANDTALHEPELEVPEDWFRLEAYPNPAATWTTVAYRLESPGDVKIDVFDVLGRPVKTLFDGYRAAGAYETVWKAENTPAGTYLIRLSAEGRTATRTISVTR